MPLRLRVFLSGEREHVLSGKLPRQLFHRLGVLIDELAHSRRVRRAHPVAEAQAVALGPDLEPEVRRAVAVLDLVLE